ncbi:hypothetical protein [Fulvivirga lutimaris]|uniref:hypothetical protein n=1 Tax=Fulvivirga lutimaris TaxID=1819566 RepID=UPI0012BB9D1F|nr:hypothetical protein [Fulvivirga lutimaris]MTI41563.1 hypothetical protein [Fulvivirga lutimaris]
MENSSAKQKYKTIQLIYMAMLVPMIVFSGFVYYSNFKAGNMASTEPNIWLYLPFGLMLMAILMARPLYTKALQNTEGKTLDQKLSVLMTALIVRMAPFEAAGLFAAASAYITGNNTILLLVLIILIQFYTNRPTLLKVENDLKVTREEIESIR